MPPVRIAIVGAGPVGMVCALALRHRGVPVTVFEKELSPVADQRAASLHPPTLEMLDDLGVAQRILPLGLVSTKYRFHDRVRGVVVAEFDLDRMRGEFRYPFVLQYEQYKLTATIAAQSVKSRNFEVRFGHCLTGLRQDGEGVDLKIASPNGAERLRATYVIGCDGGRSTVRRLAAIPFVGFTYPERFIKIATSFDFGTVNADLVLRNYFSDPYEWCNLFKVRGENATGLWRAILPLSPGEDDASALLPERIEARLQTFFPKAGPYPAAYANVYGVSQRVAGTFRKGRLLLAGDAAHVNNPIGGMGMNGGIHDAVNLAAKLADVIHGADDSLLDLYDRQRRHAAAEYIQAQTIANKRLMEERDPAVRERNFAELRRIADDPEESRRYMRRAALVDSLQTANAVT